MRIVIIGSGIGGLSMWLALRNSGHTVEIYERAPNLTEVGAGISLWANALKALEYIGTDVAQAVQSVSLPMSSSEFRIQQGHRLVIRFQADDFERKYQVRPFVSIIHRAELVDALARFVDPQKAHYGYSLQQLQVEESGVALAFQNGEQTRADLVIGADGLRSVVRNALYPSVPPRYAGYTCWRGVCPRPKRIQPGEIQEWWGRGKRFGITTLPQDRVYWFAVHNETQGGKNDNEREYVRELFAGWADPVAEIIETTPVNKVLRNDIFDRPPRPGWHNQRIVLIGDAAHPTTPNLGQGGGMAIEDAVVLARCLSRQESLFRAMGTFEKERYSRTSAMTKESWKFGKVAQWEGKWSCWLRDLVLRGIMPLIGTKTMSKYAIYDVGPIRSETHFSQSGLV